MTFDVSHDGELHKLQIPCGAAPWYYDNCSDEIISLDELTHEYIEHLDELEFASFADMLDELTDMGGCLVPFSSREAAEAYI